MTTHKSDVWSACVALMNVLLSKAVNAEVQERVCYFVSLYHILFMYWYLFCMQFKNFIAAATEGAKAATKTVINSLRLLKSIMTTVCMYAQNMHILYVIISGLGICIVILNLITF